MKWSRNKRDPVPAKATRDVRAGSIITIRTPGGGGYGDPEKRTENALETDQLDDKTSMDPGTTEITESMKHRLEEMRWPEVEQYLDERVAPTIIIPIGSTEQHGPHLPLAVDSFQARDLSREIAIAVDVLVAPLIPYGDANHHLSFPGTVSLSTETVVSVLTEVYESLISHGFVNVITVNGHRIANLPAIKTAMQHSKKQHPEAKFAAIDPLRLGVSIHQRLLDGDSEDGMHGGEFETSYMLARYPKLVAEEEFTKESYETGPYHTINLIGNDEPVLIPSTAHSPENGDLGHVGDPTLASQKKGEELWAELVAAAAEFLKSFGATDLVGSYE